MTASVDSYKARPSHRHHHHHHRKAASRPLLILHILCLLFSLTSLLIFSVTIGLWNANLFHSTGPISSDWSDMLPLIPLGATVVFNLYTLITLFLLPFLLRPSSAPLHSRSKHPLFGPKACFMLTSLLLLTLAPFLVVAGLTSVFRFWRAGIPSQSRLADGHTGNDVIICNLVNIFARECQPMLYRIGGLQIAGVVAGALSWTSVFGLWVAYGTAWQRQRRRRAARKVQKAGNGTTANSSSSSSSSRRGRSRNDSDLNVSSKNSRNGRHHHRPTGKHDYSKTTKLVQHKRLPPLNPHALAREDMSDLQPLVPPPLITSQSQRSRRHEEPSHQSPVEAHNHLVRSLSRSSRARHYIPALPLSRNRVGAGTYQKVHHYYWHHDGSGAGAAIEEARRKMKPNQTMSSWLASRYV